MSTVKVEGLGPACRLADGLWGVKTRQGRTVPTHGADEPVTAGARTPLSQSLSDTEYNELQAARDLQANPDDSDYVACTTDPSQAHSVAVYARALGTTDRSALQIPRIRSEIRRASRFIDLQALEDLGPADTPGMSRRLRVLCTAGGTIDVKSYEMSVTAASADFSTILSDITPLVFPGASPTARAVVFYDQALQGESAGVGGQATMYLNDTPGPGNPNNRGGAMAVQYNAYLSDGPRWDVLLHEIMHNMGAVQTTAPDSNGFGHCTNDADIMCYEDGGVTTALSCNHTQLDCGSDSYFHAGTPAPDSWLATHWNVGSADNRFLERAVFAAPAPEPEPEPEPVIPSLVSAPQVTGTGYVGETLTCAEGNWTVTLSRSYRWTMAGSQIATGNTYAPTASDVGSALRCEEAATSWTGHTASAPSAQTGAIQTRPVTAGPTPTPTPDPTPTPNPDPSPEPETEDPPVDPVPPPAVVVKISTRLFSGTRALRCRAARPCRISRTAKLSAKGTLSTRKAVTMKFVVQRQVRRNGRLVWKRVTLVTFAASGGTYRRALPRRSAGRYRMRVETVDSPAVKRSVGGFVHFVLR